MQEKNTYLSNSELRIPTAAYQLACQRLFAADITTAAEFKYYLESNFLPFLVIADGSDQGKFTSYYEAAINASQIQTALYRYPIYGKPSDLIEFNPKDFDASLPDKRLVGRIVDQKLLPYFTREEIERLQIKAPVILWGDSNIDINIMQIQGSAVATLPDGRTLRVSYADNNGHPFKGIGSILLEKATSNLVKFPWATSKNGWQPTLKLPKKKCAKTNALSFTAFPLPTARSVLTAFRSMPDAAWLLTAATFLWAA